MALSTLGAHVSFLHLQARCGRLLSLVGILLRPRNPFSRRRLTRGLSPTLCVGWLGIRAYSLYLSVAVIVQHILHNVCNLLFQLADKLLRTVSPRLDVT